MARFTGKLTELALEVYFFMSSVVREITSARFRQFTSSYSSFANASL